MARTPLPAAAWEPHPDHPGEKDVHRLTVAGRTYKATHRHGGDWSHWGVLYDPMPWDGLSAYTMAPEGWDTREKVELWARQDAADRNLMRDQWDRHQPGGDEPDGVTELEPGYWSVNNWFTRMRLHGGLGPRGKDFVLVSAELTAGELNSYARNTSAQRLMESARIAGVYGLNARGLVEVLGPVENEPGKYCAVCEQNNAWGRDRSAKAKVRFTHTGEVDRLCCNHVWWMGLVPGKITEGLGFVKSYEAAERWVASVGAARWAAGL